MICSVSTSLFLLNFWSMPGMDAAYISDQSSSSSFLCTTIPWLDWKGNCVRNLLFRNILNWPQLLMVINDVIDYPKLWPRTWYYVANVLLKCILLLFVISSNCLLAIKLMSFWLCQTHQAVKVLLWIVYSCLKCSQSCFHCCIENIPGCIEFKILIYIMTFLFLPPSLMSFSSSIQNLF